MSQKTIKAGPGAKKTKKRVAQQRRRGSLNGRELPPNAIKEGIKAGFYCGITAGPAVLIPYVEGSEIRQQVRDLGTRKDRSFSEGDSAANACIHAVTFILSQFHGADAEAITADLENVKQGLSELKFNVRPVEEDGEPPEGQEEADAPQAGTAEVEETGAAPAAE